MAQRTGYTPADDGVLPDALAYFPWAKNGAQVPTIAAGAFVLDDNSGVEELTFQRTIEITDGATTPARTNESIWFQARLKVPQADAWTPKSGAPVAGLEISDGERTLACVVGNGQVRLIDPSTAAILAAGEPRSTASYLDVTLAKIGSERWDLWIDGALIVTIPYLLTYAPASGSPPGGHTRWGSLSSAHTSESHWAYVEDTLGEPPPSQATVDRIHRSLPIALQTRWNSVTRALLRATVSLVAEGLHALKEAPGSLSVGRWPMDPALWEYLGDKLPASLDPAWTALDPGNVSISRERVLLAIQPTPTLTGHRAEFPPYLSAGTPLSPDRMTEYRARSTWEVVEYTADAAGRVGPHLQIRNGHFIITAQLVEVTPGVPDDGHGWVLTLTATVGTLTRVNTSLGPWRVDPYRPHTVELQSQGLVVLLIVDGTIVERVVASEFTDATTEVFAQIAGGGSGTPGPDCIALSWDAEAERRGADLSPRPWFTQDALDRLVFIGGCEQNDEVDSVKQTWQGLTLARGTTRGLAVELRRLGCGHAEVVSYSEPAGWFLEASYPEVTPIYLEADGFFALMVGEIHKLPPNFTRGEVAELARRYLLPVGTLDLRYELALAAVTTGAVTNPAPTTSRVPVSRSDWFVVGDVVVIRTADNATWEHATVSGVPTATDLDLDLLNFGPSYPSGSVVRVTIATT